jgi:hypothetical protein
VSLAGIAEWVQQVAPGRSVEQDLYRLELACEELDRRREGRPFPLSCRIAAQLVGVGKSWAARLLRRLQAAGVLQLVTDADRKARRAREYQYRGPRLLSFNRAGSLLGAAENGGSP